MDEGRLYKFGSDFKNHELIKEIDGDSALMAGMVIRNGVDKKTIWRIQRWSNFRRKITGGLSVL